MNTDQLSVFKNRLQKELETVSEELETVGVQNPENADDWEGKETDMDVSTPMADENESADKIEEYDENRAINDTLEIRFNNIKRALRKIEDGSYGICEVNGEEIDEERLDANPAARTCRTHMEEEGTLES